LEPETPLDIINLADHGVGGGAEPK